MGAASDKGDLLEDAVQMIERVLLRSSSQDDLVLERKKLLNHHDVHHEIDLYVRLTRPHGYDAAYIFECKNWKKPVGKNEIITFAEKISVANAQRGFFVATEFTKDAIARAALDPRMVLVNATATEFETALAQPYFHYLGVRISWTIDLSPVEPGREAGTIDLAAPAALGATPVDLNVYGEAWANEVANQRMATFPSGDVAPGRYEFKLEAERSFEPDHLRVDGHAYAAAKLTVDVVAEVQHPAVIAEVDVENRGIGRKLASAKLLGIGEFQTWLTSVPRQA